MAAVPDEGIKGMYSGMCDYTRTTSEGDTFIDKVNLLLHIRPSDENSNNYIATLTGYTGVVYDFIGPINNGQFQGSLVPPDWHLDYAIEDGTMSLNFSADGKSLTGDMVAHYADKPSVGVFWDITNIELNMTRQ